jgi:hypothetical protein
MIEQEFLDFLNRYFPRSDDMLSVPLRVVFVIPIDHVDEHQHVLWTHLEKTASRCYTIQPYRRGIKLR